MLPRVFFDMGGYLKLPEGVFANGEDKVVTEEDLRSIIEHGIAPKGIHYKPSLPSRFQISYRVLTPKIAELSVQVEIQPLILESRPVGSKGLVDYLMF